MRTANRTQPPRRLPACTFAAVSCGLLFLSGVALAEHKGKPHGGPGGGGDALTLTGTIYYEDPSMRPFTLDSDGILALPLSAWGHPSFNTHAGVSWKVKRYDPWFVYDPNNPPTAEFFLRNNVFVVNETDGTETPLWFDGTLDVASVEWLPGDEKIGYVGRHFDAGGNTTEYGLYTADVDFDPGTGAPVGIVGQPAQVIDYLASGEATDEFPAFSPDLSEVAIVHTVDDFPQSMRVYSVASGLMIREFAAGDAWSSVRWSPDGTTLVYRGFDGLTVSDPWGNNRAVLVKESWTRVKTVSTIQPRWSPDSQQIVYLYKVNDQRTGFTDDLHIINSDGTQDTQITGDELNSTPYPVAWRN